MRVRNTIALLALTGCSVSGPISIPPASTVEQPEGGLQVALLWTEAVDLDLYVTDPKQETVYFAHPSSSSGGELEADVRCSGKPVDRHRGERVRFRAPMPGQYRVGVDFPKPCSGGPDEAEFRLVVDVGARRLEHRGSLRREDFRYIALEFDVAAEDEP